MNGGSSRPPRRVRLSDGDLALLAFMSQHRLILPDHAAVLLGVSPDSAQARLRKLGEHGFVRRETIFRGEPPCYLIVRDGLAAVGSGIRAPTLDLRAYQHDVGVAWLWLAARGGTFGALREILAERTLRSRDGARESGVEPLGVRLGGLGPRGLERLHYPDLLLTTADGRRVALELELTPKGRVRLETILAGYGSDPRVDAAVYLVESGTIARPVQAAARRLGVSSRVHVQLVRLAVARPADGAGRAMQRAATGHPMQRATTGRAMQRATTGRAMQRATTGRAMTRAAGGQESGPRRPGARTSSAPEAVR